MTGESTFDKFIPDEKSIDEKASDLAKQLVGVGFEDPKLLEDMCVKIQEGIVKKYGLPPSELMKPGHQQEYYNAIMSKFDEADIKVSFKKIDGTASYYPGGLNFDSGGAPGLEGRQYHGGIVEINPEEVNIADGNEICPILASMYIYAMLSKEAEKEGRKLDGNEMKRVALMGSFIFNGEESVKRLFKGML